MGETSKHRLRGDDADDEDSHKLQVGINAVLSQAAMPLQINSEFRNIARRRFDKGRLSVVQQLNKGN